MCEDMSLPRPPRRTFTMRNIALGPTMVFASIAMTAGAPLGAWAAPSPQGQDAYYDYQRTINATTSGLVAPLTVSTVGTDRVYVLDHAGSRLRTLHSAGHLIADHPDPEPVDPGDPLSNGRDMPLSQVGLEDGSTVVLRGRLPASGDDGGVDRCLFRIDAEGSYVWNSRCNIKHDVLDVPVDGMSSVTADSQRRVIYVLATRGPHVVAFSLETGEFLGLEDLPSNLILDLRRIRQTDYEWYIDLDVMDDSRVALINQDASEVVLRRLKWGKAGVASSSFKIEGRPTRIAAGGNELFVLDQDGSVRRFNPQGILLERFDVRGPAPRPSTQIMDLAVADDGSLYAVDGSSGDIHVFVPRAGTLRQGRPIGDACAFDARKVANPSRVPLGDPVRVRLDVSGTCPRRSGMDLLVLIERDIDMVGFPRNTLPRSKAVTERLIEVADLGRDRIGIMSNDYVLDYQEIHAISDRRDSLIPALRQLEQVETVDWGKPHLRYLSIAQNMLEGEGSRDDAEKVMLVFTSWKYPGIVLPDRFRVLQKGTRIVVIEALSKDEALRLKQRYYADFAQMVMWPKWLASGFWDQFPAGEIEPEVALDLYHHLQESTDPIRAEVLARSMVVSDEIPANMRVDLSSVQPPAEWDADRRTLIWRLTDLPFATMSMSYTVYPEDVGVWPTNVHAWGGYTDGLGRSGAFPFPVPMVEVLAPTPTPEPTRTSVPPSITPSPSLTASRTATMSPTPRPIYLPMLLRESCTPQQRLGDVVLVLDASQSMTGSVAPGSAQSKLDAARAAAGRLLDILRLGDGDQAAIVSFNAEAFVLAGLTADRGGLNRALDAIKVAPQTCIFCGVDAAVRELASVRRRLDSAPVVILLTDGRSSPQPVDLAVARAGEAKLAGVRIYTIGLGEDLDEAALREMASGPESYFHAPSGAHLARIYQDIAADIPCPVSAFWSGR